MYYIKYDKISKSVVGTFLTMFQLPETSNYAVAEYKGVLPKGDWLSVDNIHEEIETWTEKEIVESYDNNGNLVTKEVEVEMSKKHIICDLVAHFFAKRELTEEQKAKLKEKQYNALVTKLIRKKYSANAVEALLANYADDDVKYQLEFDEFTTYRKECKAKARQEIYNL